MPCVRACEGDVIAHLLVVGGHRRVVSALVGLFIDDATLGLGNHLSMPGGLLPLNASIGAVPLLAAIVHDRWQAWRVAGNGNGGDRYIYISGVVGAVFDVTLPVALGGSPGCRHQ